MSETLDKKKVVVGMSGGVDSTVAVKVLLDQGYEVIGVTMKLWDDESENYIMEEGGCCSLSSVEDARRVASEMGVPFYVSNMKKEFKDKVIDYFIDEYKKGRTPNPCIACNKYMKFDDLLNLAKKLGAYYVATGHYAKRYYDEKSGRYILERSNSDRKDQTYALYNITQEQLKHTLFPLGDFESKEDVRKVAEELDLVIANKPDSQEICFIPDDDYPRFLEENMDTKVKAGNFVDTKGNILGKHKGIIYYTIGQRKGLGITFGKPMYVVEIKASTNEVVLGDNKEVFSSGLIADDFNGILIDAFDKEYKCKAKIRYSAKEADCTVIPLNDGKIKVMFEDMQRAITPGQSVVMYKDNKVVGGALIVAKID